jgi:hypothetical protein
LFSLFTLVRLALSTLSAPGVDELLGAGDLFFSKLENQLRCFEIASFALIFLSGLSGAPFRAEAADCIPFWLLLTGLPASPFVPFLYESAAEETLLLLLGEKERGEVERERSSPDSLSSDLEPGRWEIDEVREPAGEVTLLVPLLLSSKRLSPDPILSKRARAELNLSW